MSDPNLHHSRQALATLDHLVVQDIFLTETCAFADVVLPASAWPEKNGTVSNTDRRVQLGRQALKPPGDARQDLWIIIELARRLGLNWDYGAGVAQWRDRGDNSLVATAQVYEEMRRAMPSIAGLSWERIQNESSVTYPYREDGGESENVLFQTQFPTPNGKGLIVPADFIHADELPDEAYPFIFITGRQLEHWHTGAMTRRANVLDAIEPAPTLSIHPDDLSRLDMQAGDEIVVASRRGRVQCVARADRGLTPGEVFMPFAYHEAAANLITNEAFDPFGKIPEFKFCAVMLAKATV
jgi:formate dehydrogenase major subunit